MEMATSEVHSKGDREFESVELGDIRKKRKIPRRIIHFASGETMEEYSTDEEEELQERKEVLPAADPSKLTWGPYLWFYMLRVATSTLSVCDFLGEKIASVLGVSTPKYQYAIDEYYRMQKEKKRRKRMKCQTKQSSNIRSSKPKSRMKSLQQQSSQIPPPAPLSTSALSWKKGMQSVCPKSRNFLLSPPRREWLYSLCWELKGNPLLPKTQCLPQRRMSKQKV
uniref:Family with sequence similarity 177 member A1 n=1 Tax=Xenopus tropicalis TaxID=8364 RepID=A0A6I8SGR3_XENTR